MNLLEELQQHPHMNFPDKWLGPVKDFLGRDDITLREPIPTYRMSRSIGGSDNWYTYSTCGRYCVDLLSSDYMATWDLAIRTKIKKATVSIEFLHGHNNPLYTYDIGGMPVTEQEFNLYCLGSAIE